MYCSNAEGDTQTIEIGISINMELATTIIRKYFQPGSFAPFVIGNKVQMNKVFVTTNEYAPYMKQ